MGEFAFIKLSNRITNRGTTRYYLNIIRLVPGIKFPRRTSFLTCHTVGWVLAWFPTSADDWDIPEDNIHVINLNANTWNMTVGEIPAAKRQQMNTWLTNKGFDTSWITLTTTIGDVFEEILDFLNGYREVKPREVNWCKDHLDITDLNLTMADIPVAKRDKIAAWWDKQGLDRTWIVGSTTIKEVLTYLSYHAKPGEQIKKKLMVFCKRYIS